MILKNDGIPVFDTDNVISGFDWRYLIDTYVANYGHDVDEAKLRSHLRYLLNEIRNDALDSFEAIKEELVKETANS